MNLLLLLSALMSALSGLGASVRAPATVQAVAGAATARVAAPARQAVVTRRPVGRLAGPEAQARGETRAAFALTDAIPLWASRRRE